MGTLLRAAAFLTRRQWTRWHDLTAKPQEIQDHLLFDLIKRNRATRFGRDHRFDAIRSLSDYRAQVSVGDYARLRPYIECAQNGEAGVCRVVEGLFATGRLNVRSPQR